VASNQTMQPLVCVLVQLFLEITRYSLTKIWKQNNLVQTIAAKAEETIRLVDGIMTVKNCYDYSPHILRRYLARLSWSLRHACQNVDSWWSVACRQGTLLLPYLPTKHVNSLLRIHPN
jgi:hypothetical protein